MESGKPLIDEAIVGYIDVMGYSKLVDKLLKNPEGIKEIRDIMKGLSIDLVKEFNDPKFKFDHPKESDRQLAKKVAKATRVRFISDTIIFTLLYSDLKISTVDYDKDEIFSFYLYRYLFGMGFLCCGFIGLTGNLLRGGISNGLHYEEDIIDSGKASLFIVSKAYINAYQLEEKGSYPRIIINGFVKKYLETCIFPYLKETYFIDEKGQTCLDIYFALKKKGMASKVLSGIKEGVVSNLEANIHNPKELGYLKDFCKYHNERVAILGFLDLLIDIRKY